LLKPNAFQIDTNLSFTYGEVTRLIISGFSVLPLIILGDLESERTRNNVLSPALSLRYGFLKDLQGDVRVPLVYQHQMRTRLSNAQSTLVNEEATQFGLGDIEFGLTYQLLYERGWSPDLSISLRARAPVGRSQFDIFETMAEQGAFANIEDFVSRLNAEGLPIGSGYWGTTVSIGLSKAFDPIVLFGSIGYSYNLEQSGTIIVITGEPVEAGVLLRPQAVWADLKPGDSIFFSAGAAVALTGQVTVNFSFSDRITSSTKQNGVKIAGSNSNVGQFSAGFTLGLTRGVTVEFGGSIGITADAPSFGLSLGVVKTFDSVRDLWPFGRKSNGG